MPAFRWSTQGKRSPIVRAQPSLTHAPWGGRSSLAASRRTRASRCRPGFSERLQAECAELAPPSTKAGVVRPPEYMPAGAVRHASWLGGAILAKIVFTQNQHMSHYDYDEEGPTAVHRKL